MTLATRTPTLAITNMDELARVSDMFAKSGLFADARDAAQAGVKIMAGQAWNIDPFSAMTGIHIIKGKPTISAGLMAAAVKGHERYDYRVRERNETRCAIEFFEDGESLGLCEYTFDMAKRAGLTGNDTWRKHPEAMLFARCMSSGVRTYCPDVFSASVYTPEELGANVNEDGDVIEVTAVEVKPATPAVEPTKRRNAKQTQPEPEPTLDQVLQEAAVELEPETPAPEPINDVQLGRLAKALKRNSITPETARSFFTWYYKRDITTAKQLTQAEGAEVLLWTDTDWENVLEQYAGRMFDA